MAKSTYSKKRYNYKYRGRSYRPGSSYAGKSLYTMAKAFAKPGAKLAVKLLKNTLGLNTECKYLDTVMGSTFLSTQVWVAMTNPVIIPQGITTSTRVGNNIRLQSLQQKITFRSGSSSNACRVRILGFVQPKMLEAGQVFLPLDVLEDSTAQMNSPYNMNTNGYKVIQDRTFEISADPQDGSTRQINFNYKPLDHQIEWLSTDTTGVVGNLLRGYIRWYIFTDAPAGQEPTFEAYTRVRYIDN